MEEPSQPVLSNMWKLFQFDGDQIRTSFATFLFENMLGKNPRSAGSGFVSDPATLSSFKFR